MNWSKAKNFAILFLAFLNVFLGVMLLNGRGQYRMSAEQVKNIKEVLARAKIGVDADLPVSFEPLAQLSIARYEYDAERLIGLFFKEPSEVVKTDEPDQTVYRWNDAVMTIRNGYITLDYPYGTGKTESVTENFGEVFGAEAAKAVTDGFVGKMRDFMTDFKYEGAEYDEYSEGYRLKYKQVYRNNVVYTNFVEFFVTEKGVTQMDCQYGAPLGFSGAKMEICSADEALLNFMEQITGYYGSADYAIVISKVDMVYYQEEGTTRDDVALKAEPCYRITFGDGKETGEILINAYINF